MKRRNPDQSQYQNKRTKGTHDHQTPRHQSRQNPHENRDHSSSNFPRGNNFGEPSSGYVHPLSRFPPALKLGPQFDVSSLFNLTRAFVTRREDAPENALTGGLTKDIWNFFIQEQQSEDKFRQKIELWRTLDEVFGVAMNCKTLAFGSTLNGFGDRKCDLDFCLFFDTNDRGKNGSINMLFKARKVLRSRCWRFVKGDIEMIPAKVPILKFYDSTGEIEVDISCNNPLSIKNTHMLHYYGLLDWRVRPLIVCIKIWASKANIKDAKSQTFSSYTLALMIINFLQCGVSPPVLPSLQWLHPEVFDINVPETELTFHMPPPTFKSLNKASLGSLLVDFFDFYANKFDFTSQAGSMRTGTILSISDCASYAQSYGLPVRQWEAYVCVEEPFERTNSGRAVIRREGFDSILYHLNGAWKMLRDGGSLMDLIKLRYVN